MALLSEGVSVDVKRRYSDTYVHLGRKAATMIAPDAPRHFLPKFAFTMEVFMVTGLLSPRSPLNVNVDIALMPEVMPEVMPEAMPEVICQKCRRC
jgi:hypothetical protein